MEGLLCDATPMVHSDFMSKLATELPDVDASFLRQTLTRTWHMYAMKNEDPTRIGFKELMFSNEPILDWPFRDVIGERFSLLQFRYEPRARVFAQGQHGMETVEGWWLHIMYPRNLESKQVILEPMQAGLLLEVVGMVPKIKAAAQGLSMKKEYETRLKTKDEEVRQAHEGKAISDMKLGVATMAASKPSLLGDGEQKATTPRRPAPPGLLRHIVLGLVGVGVGWFFFPMGYGQFSQIQIAIFAAAALAVSSYVAKQRYGY